MPSVSLGRRSLLRFTTAALASTALARRAFAEDCPGFNDTRREEPALDPQRQIVDPHHHLWDKAPVPGIVAQRQLFLLPDLLETIGRSGHNVTQTVFVESTSMYRADGPVEMRPIGEVEFVNGIAAAAASGRYGTCRAAAGIVGYADLRLGDAVKPVLEAQVAAGNGRFRGIRTRVAYSETGMYGRPSDPAVKELLLDPTFRKGVATLAPLDVSLEVWAVHPQVPQVTDLASAFPNTAIVLGHSGRPVDPFGPRAKEVFAEWKKAVTELARRPNVVVKIGGLGMYLTEPFGSKMDTTPSTVLAPKWRPYVETLVAVFGPNRCMFESNYPSDDSACTYGALWNTFKLITAKYSDAEKAALFSGTAKRVYKLG